MAEAEFAHLNLREWPFQVVPSLETARIWIGRPEFEKRLRSLLRQASHVPASRIVLLWASFGSGKSHTLLHLQHLAGESAGLVPIYAATPDGLRSFKDIYAKIVDAGFRSGLAQETGRQLLATQRAIPASDVELALMRLGGSDSETQTATAWLNGGRPRLTDLRQLGIGSRLESTGDAVDALDDLVKALRLNGDRRVLLLLDELQELENIPQRQLSECVGGLHKVFDQNPQGLTMVLSFTTGTQDAMQRLLGDALIDRTSSLLTLPPMEREEAVSFIIELVRIYSLDKAQAPAPFTREAVYAVVEHVEDAKKTLSPRNLIQPFGELLAAADAAIDAGEMEAIDADAAKAMLEDATLT